MLGEIELLGQRNRDSVVGMGHLLGLRWPHDIEVGCLLTFFSRASRVRNRS